MIPVRNSAEFARLIEGLAYDVVHANIHWKLYCELHEALQQTPTVAHQSNTFWHLTLQAQNVTAVQHLCRSFDQQKGALSLHSWLKTIRSNLHLFNDAQFRTRLAANPYVASLAKHARRPDPTTLESDIRACSPKDPLVHRLVLYRNNVGAHRSAKGVVAGTLSTFDLSVTLFEELLERARTVLNRYTDLFAAETHSIKMFGSDDYKFVIASVAEAVERSRAQSAAVLARLQTEQP